MKQMLRVGIAVAMVMLMGMSAQASEWNFYGNARIGTFWSNADDGAGTETDTFSQYLHGNSRVGAKVTVSDELKAGFEYGTGVNVRKLYGEWNFGAGKFLVGQTYTPVNANYSSQVFSEDMNLEKYGAISTSRDPMLQLTFGDFKIAAVQPESDDLGTGDPIEYSMPRIEASYKMSFNNVSMTAVAGYNAYEIDRQHDVDSYIVGLAGKVNVGAAFLAGSFYTGQNLGPYGFKANGDDPVISGNEVRDNDGFGYTLIAGYKLNDMIKLEAGYGYTESELDQSGSKEDDASAYYLQAKITMAPGVYVIPEIGKIDEGEDSTGAEEGDTTYYGAKWQISF
ncbi:MAG TPA: hypothetical protein DHV36_12295 [Desulfobacteraceae bacterium]|nr:hypothetical protein [Desulfobacteraceae bacterium]|tara:strand:+ start:647 stop:1660 length:1014 start_codon:yes stop_codon:yes gene_type:complete